MVVNHKVAKFVNNNKLQVLNRNACQFEIKISIRFDFTQLPHSVFICFTCQ